MNSLYKVAKFIHIRYLNAKDNRVEDLKPLSQMSSLLAANFSTNRINKLCAFENKFLQVHFFKIKLHRALSCVTRMFPCCDHRSLMSLAICWRVCRGSKVLLSPILSLIVRQSHIIGSTLYSLFVFSQYPRSQTSQERAITLRPRNVYHSVSKWPTGNRIAELSGLQMCPCLQRLDVCNNVLVNLTSVTSLDSLRELHLVIFSFTASCGCLTCLKTCRVESLCTCCCRSSRATR